ncbi:uncharacterized protein Triagg1_1441 [Trichoderma aggressivum f. europaeum]|uniref:Velvet domain-containing protein n=1 Tax=Trichoderma aggressivum f. europaeum TaxID=173218 RepID=A0AAE1JGZ3_9HYPO|nr:hypothetical protein Triagg1_1441 [Trichoderma aggressivum f. europaeum]
MAVTQAMPNPAVQARVGQVLPLIRVQHVDNNPAVNYFATPVLVSDTGAVVDALQATRAVTGRPINGGFIQYTFTDLVILAPGTYYLRADVYELIGGAGLVAQINSIPIVVTN